MTDYEDMHCQFEDYQIRRPSYKKDFDSLQEMEMIDKIVKGRPLIEL